MSKSLPCILVFVATLLALPAFAALELAPLFRDGAVLQQGAPVPVFGWADPGSRVVVEFAGARATATAGADGRWLAKLPAQPVRTTGAELIVSDGAAVLTLRDIVVGEVWLCSGQSNMEWQVSQSDNAAQETASANHPLIRHIRVPKKSEASPDPRFDARWEPATPKTVGKFSAAAYFFAREIHRATGAPVGIINASWGGKMIEVFSSPDALAASGLADVVLKREADSAARRLATVPDYEKKLAEWEKARDAAAAEGRKFTAAKPADPRGIDAQHQPSGLYNGMLYPVVQYGIRGMLWYQGEHNISRPDEYRKLFPAFIADLRAKFGQGDFPFYYAQLANFEAPLDKSREGYARLREAQTETLSLPNTGMAVTFDTGRPDNVHPTNKQAVGDRLARIAKAKIHGLGGECSGPTLVSAERSGGTARLRFDHATGGLKLGRAKAGAAGTSGAGGAGAAGRAGGVGAAGGFELAGADGVFHVAEARVEGDFIVLQAPAVVAPARVRYAWANAPEATLFNGEGLPAPPFRCDLKQ